MVRKLRKAFPVRNKDSKKPKKPREDKDSEKEQDASDKSDDSEDDFRCKEAVRRSKMRQKKQIELPNINLDEYVGSTRVPLQILLIKCL